MKTDRRANNITWHHNGVSPQDRMKQLGQRGCVLWMTGLSGSGKSTIAVALEANLMQKGHVAYVLDGDNIRHGLNADLDFSEAGRRENIRRIAHVAALMADAGLIVITAFISPYAEDRAAARHIIDSHPNPQGKRFTEIYVNTPLAVCEERDPKSLYAKARKGEIPHFTGINAPFEAPPAPDIEICTARYSVAECVACIIEQTAAFHVQLKTEETQQTRKP